MDLDRLILIVTGSDLRAEAGDRPSAYLLRDAVERRMPGYEVVVCSDLWYLNNAALRSRPTISVGGPGVNAFSAFLGDKLPSVFAIDGVLMIQHDPEEGAVACCWGADADATQQAVRIFIDRYLDAFVESERRVA